MKMTPFAAAMAVLFAGCVQEWIYAAGCPKGQS